GSIRLWYGTLRVGAADDKSLRLGRPLDRPAENQGLDLVKQPLGRQGKAPCIARRHLAEHDQDRLGPKRRQHRRNQLVDSAEVAAAGIVRRDVRRDIDDIAAAKLADAVREGEARSVLPDELVQPRLDDRQPAFANRSDSDRIAIETGDGKAL